jgi:hypothetical protein
MDRAVLDEITACLERDRTIFYYFRDRCTLAGLTCQNWIDCNWVLSNSGSMACGGNTKSAAANGSYYRWVSLYGWWISAAGLDGSAGCSLDSNSLN